MKDLNGTLAKAGMFLNYYIEYLTNQQYDKVHHKFEIVDQDGTLHAKNSQGVLIKLSVFMTQLGVKFTNR